MVKQATVSSDGAAEVGIELPTPAYPGQERITDAINAAIKAQNGDAPDAKVSFSWVVKGKETGGKIGLRVKMSSPSAVAKAESVRARPQRCSPTV